MEDVVLPVRQEKLLEELASCQEEAPEEDAKFCDDFAAFQALRKRCLDQQAARRKEGDAQSQRLGWLQQLHQVSSAAEEAQQLVMAKLKHVEAEQRELERKTIWLRNHCQEALEHQDHLNAYAEQIAGRLEALCCFDSIAKELDDSELVSRPVQLEELLQRLEAAAAFVESRYDFLDAPSCRNTFDHLRNRVCILLRSNLQYALEAADSQVQDLLWQQEEDATSVDTQIFYTSFHMIAPSVKPAMSVLYRQSHLHRQYAATLDAAESSLADLRRSFPATHWESLKELTPELPELVRQATSYLLDTSSREIRCFEAFFEPRRPQEALQSLLKELCHRCCQVLLPALREHESWEALASAAELLKAELQDFRGALEVRLALREMFAAAQQQLVRLARQELSAVDLEKDASVPGFNDRALKLLAACYRVLETPDFESLANMLLGPSTKAVHLESAPAQLLRLSQLLRLREQLAAFEDDLLSTEVVRPSGVAGDLERLTRVTLKGWRLARHRRWEAEIREVCNGLLEHVIFDQLLEGEKGGIEERCCKLLPSVAAHFRAFLGPTTSVLFEVLKERILKLHLLEAGPPAESLVRCLERILDHAATAHFSDQRCVDADSVQMEDALRAEEANKKSRPVMH
ncbi:unnamed protein product [Durusdinium trenchii]|uniref:Conserved oligomeric Golgi complex subunit 3 n=2 Tax=Durusdinium trenchii TaxID=1381693 RepID=A0ABP0IYJ3_9DINO